MMRCLVALVLVLAVLRGGPSVADEYRIGINDELSLRVQEWLPVEGEIREWDGMAGAYVVGADGTISVPFVGTVEAAGRTRGEISAEIGARLQQRLALSTVPDAAVDVTRYRPVYVAGLVSSPGEYPYAPGLTVRQAVSLAGGLADELRPGSAGAREVIQAEGMLRVFEGQKARLMITLARLDAELAGENELGPVDGIGNAPEAQALIRNHATILAARRARLEAELDAVDQQKVLLENEVDALEQKQVALQRQRDIAAEALESASSLAERGLAANNRVVDSERFLTSVENQLLDTSTAILRARQGIVGSDKDRTALIDARVAEVGMERQQAEAQLAEVEERIVTQRALSLQAAHLVDAAGLTAAGGVLPEPTYTIIRGAVDAQEELAADGAALLRPGDVVEVGVAPPALQ